MKVFISHSSKNKELVLRFAEFLEDIQDDIDVFCSSEKGSIEIGEDFVRYVFKQLDECDVFVPILSNEYFESKFCMIELGVAYSFSSKQFANTESAFILPLALAPLSPNDVLSGSPLDHLDVYSLSQKDDIISFLKSIRKTGKLRIGTGRKDEVTKYIDEINRMLLNNISVFDSARVSTYFDDSIDYLKKEDIISIGNIENGITVAFNINPYDKPETSFPNFFSIVLAYVDFLNLNQYLRYSADAKFCFQLTNFTNSIHRIHIEFKYSESHSILDVFSIDIKRGINNVAIPLSKMRSTALERISEICFVIHPDDLVEDEGIYILRDFRIE